MGNLLTAFLQLFFPDCCLACESVISYNEKSLCTVCLATLPYPFAVLRKSSIVAERLWGEVAIAHAVALFPFTKESPVQKIIHKIKFKNRSYAAIQLGQYFGAIWERIQQEHNNPLDAVIPVPLHPKRLQERGYNQSQKIAKGIAKVLSLPCPTNWLHRVLYTETQTRKSKDQRKENVKGAFHIPNPSHVQGKHLLLVDDLITTGATLKECIKLLNAAGACDVSVAVLAVAI